VLLLGRAEPFNAPNSRSGAPQALDLTAKGRTDAAMPAAVRRIAAGQILPAHGFFLRLGFRGPSLQTVAAAFFVQTAAVTADREHLAMMHGALEDCGR
jgi:hypothetical protein